MGEAGEMGEQDGGRVNPLSMCSLPPHSCFPHHPMVPSAPTCLGAATACAAITGRGAG